MTPSNMPSRNAPEDIPPMTSIAPAIFVPTDRDFTKTPPPLSDDPATRINASIEALDWHAARVENNMILLCVREAERIRRGVEQQEENAAANATNNTNTINTNTQSNNSNPHLSTGNELLLEERILEEDSEAVLRILRESKYQDSEDNNSSNNSNNPRSRPPRPRGPDDPEYADLATLREKKMFRTPVDEGRQTPREQALTHVLNLVKWGWDEQLETHRVAIEKEKADRRSRVAHNMVTLEKNMRDDGGDRMDIDG
ncbi:hypothetical protein F5Y08DRAFT_210263 [Xylaria arbuscula]|nr:hypothetical protein F5Y08DRAFT_210263 [Xylaria arbuscula]